MDPRSTISIAPCPATEFAQGDTVRIDAAGGELVFGPAGVPASA